MYLRVPIVRVKIGEKFFFETGDTYLQSAEVVLSENERASSCNFSIYDPGLKVLNLLLTEFQSVGGIMVPTNLLSVPGATVASTASATSLPTVGTNLRGDELARAIVAEAQRQGVTMPEQIAYIIGTVQRETSMGEIMIEQGSRSYFNYLEGRTDIGNTQSGDGYRFRGRGFIQLTGRVNYERWSKRLGVDMINKPDLAAEPRYALPILVISMKEGITTGKKLNDYIRPGSVDFYNARRIVNALDHAADIAGYARNWLARLPTLGAATTSTSTSTPLSTHTSTSSTSGFQPPAGSVSSSDQSAYPKAATTVDVSQGVLVQVETAFNDGVTTTHEFFLTGVRGSNEVPHTTKIRGNQLRYVLAKGAKLSGSAGKIYKIRDNVTFRQVANEVTRKVGAQVGNLDELADVVFEKSYQAESDYEYLLRLARERGLFLRSNGITLEAKRLKATDQKITINANVLMQGSTWGDSASERRILSVPVVSVERSQAEDDTEREGTSDEAEGTFALTEIAKSNPLTAAAGGILALTQSAGTNDQIGKGFEGQLIINSVLLPIILEVQPGQIVDLHKDTGLGEALIRGYRIGDVRHNYKNNKLITTLGIYLPVSVKPPLRQVESGSSAPVAAGNIVIPANLQASPKKGDAIAQYKVSSPYGPRTPPKTATGYGTKIHQGVDVPMPIGTPLYPICNPGETVTVTKSSGGGGGLVAEFRQGDWIFQYMHLSEVFTGVRKYGEPICKSGNSGNSSGPHLHFTQRKVSDRSTVPPPAGYIFWAITGRAPS